MRHFAVFTAATLFAMAATAQTAAPASPVVPAPTAPTAPTAATAPITTTTTLPAARKDDLSRAIGNLAGHKNSQQKAGQLMLIGSILSCTQKTAGQQPTQTFYNEMNAIGKQAEGYCKQGNATEARALLVSTFTTKKDDPVAKAALACYDAQSSLVAGIGGAQIAADAANYARWMRDPALAATEMKDTDICRNSDKVKVN